MSIYVGEVLKHVVGGRLRPVTVLVIVVYGVAVGLIVV